MRILWQDVRVSGDTTNDPGNDGTRSTHSQTLSRGIRALEVLAEASEPLAIAEIAQRLGLHRSVVYRMLRTLEDHGLVRRDAAGRLRLGPGLAALARSVSRDLQEVAQPELARLAERFGVTAFIGVHDRHDAVTLMTVEPRTAHAAIAQRPGTRHLVDRGATGVAILVAMRDDELEQLRADGLDIDDARVAQARERGYARSRDEVIPGLSSVAVPLVVPGDPVAMALSIVSIAEIDDIDALADALAAAAGRIARAAA